ncbi:MAG TPA: hypothetical protein VFP60_04480 [Pseudolabrys sp.]|nr:hypothetical protein [Pseudolabrys sp.]
MSVVIDLPIQTPAAGAVSPAGPLRRLPARLIAALRETREIEARRVIAEFSYLADQSAQY